jgi:hypothetical protein
VDKRKIAILDEQIEKVRAVRDADKKAKAMADELATSRLPLPPAYFELTKVVTQADDIAWRDRR